MIEKQSKICLFNAVGTALLKQQ